MNEKIFYLLNNLALQNELFDTLVIFIADWLIYWMLFGILALLFFKKITIKQFVKILVFPIILWGISWIIKQGYFSPRPFLKLDDVKLLFTHGLNNSMPSGHTTLASALAIITYLYNKKIGILFSVFALLIALSRIIVGVHWPLDILASFLLAAGGIFILNKIKFDFLSF